jgi:hypothetical protein
MQYRSIIFTLATLLCLSAPVDIRAPVSERIDRETVEEKVKDVAAGCLAMATGFACA